MAVAKKACVKAVGRNRIKRVIRESFRQVLAAQSAENALDIVVLPTVMATNLSNKALDESLLRHWRRLINKADSRGSASQQERPRTQR